MNRSLCLISVFCFVAAGIASAQESAAESRGNPQNQRFDSSSAVNMSTTRLIPGLRRRILVLNINTRVLENEQNVVWNETHQKITMPGSPVSIRLVGANGVVAMQFTPFLHQQGNMLIAQSQIWINNPDSGASYYTSIQTIPMEFDEPIYFFPLGTSGELKSSIEMMITVNRYRENAVSEAAANND